LVSVAVTVTFTPGRAAPEGSVTIPVIVPVSAWLNKLFEHRRRRHNGRKKTTNLGKILVT
jgi:hypothetical protein